MNRCLPPRTLRRIANILEEEARDLEAAHTILQDDGTRQWSTDPMDQSAKRRCAECRRHANRLREAAG